MANIKKNGFFVFAILGLSSIGFIGSRDQNWHQNLLVYLFAVIVTVHVVIVRAMFQKLELYQSSQTVGAGIDSIFSIFVLVVSASLAWRTAFSTDFSRIGYSIIDIMTWIGTFSTLLFVMLQTAANYALERSRSELGLRADVAKIVISLRELLLKVELNWTSPTETHNTKTEMIRQAGEIEALLLSFVAANSIPVVTLARARHTVSALPDRFESKNVVVGQLLEVRELLNKLQASLFDREYRIEGPRHIGR